jgi:hypothetical protein
MRFRNLLLNAIAWLFGVLLIFGLVKTGSHPQPPNLAAKEHDDLSLSRATAATIALRKAVLNPDSFALEEVLGMRDGSFCYSYRAQKELFGGINREHAVLPKKASNPDQSDAAWRHYCANKTGADLTDNIKTMVRLVQ